MDSRGAALLAQWRAEVDGRLAAAIPAAPAGLGDAMAYALLGPGKRLRPLMVLGAALTVGPRVPSAGAWRAAVAVECVHAYSLVHDDLPAMDDDDLRRGRPTVHRAFDEATAILTGDALLTLAFDHLAGGDGLKPSAALRLVSELARAAGAEGMVGGQQIDLRLGAAASHEEVIDLHRRKTGALFTASCRMGALASGADDGALAALTDFGRRFGTLYQAVDDVLDDGGADLLRPSLVRHLGIAGARAYAAKEADAALAVLAPFGAGAAALGELVDQVRTMLG